MINLSIQSLPVLICLASDMMFFGKTRVFPGHERILKELQEKTRINRSPRTLMRWLKRMESHGLINRAKRHRFSARNGWEFRSSLYGINMPGWYLLVKAGLYTWDQFHRLQGIAKASFRKKGKPRKAFRPSGQLTSVSDILGGLGFNTS
jgi:hypothetical protein